MYLSLLTLSLILLTLVHAQPDYCLQGVDYGNCFNQAKVTRYYYDRNSGRCADFAYTGCGGNQNHFRSLQDCQEHCERYNRALLPGFQPAPLYPTWRQQWLGQYPGQEIFPNRLPITYFGPGQRSTISSRRTMVQLNAAGSNQATALVFLDQVGPNIQVSGNIHRMIPGHTYSLHVHQYGDIRQACDAVGGLFRGPPAWLYGQPGGAAQGPTHVYGPNSGGIVRHVITGAQMSELIGRSMLLEDLGPEGSPRASARVACGVIGLVNPAFGKS